MAKANAGEQLAGGGTSRTARKGAGTKEGAPDGAGQANGGAGKPAVKSVGASGTTTAKRASTSRPAADTGSGTSPAAGGAAASPGKPAAAKRAAPAKSASTGAASGKQGGEQAAKGPAKKPVGGANTAGGTSRGGKPNLAAELREFVGARPDGWGHGEWTGLLDHLASRGHDTSNPDGIGMQLERERLSARLAGLGLAPARVKKLVERFGTLWSLGHADAAELEAAGLTSAQVDQVARDVRG
ncbi:MAG TPA: hypothetical protein VFH27_09335 [Longimicrobiaceae bacterium]|nr:hypothetical protein [Longimicrobiaceae bacterium]